MTITREEIERLRNLPVPTRLLDDGRQLWLYPMLLTHRLCIGLPGNDSYDDAWCFDNFTSGLCALIEWNPLDPSTPEPTGWIKHPASGRRSPNERKE
jgi:hypothetical protein